LKINPKNQITMDEIENKFQLKIINVNKIIANKRKEIELKAISG
jgi:hypothetical protein